MSNWDNKVAEQIADFNLRARARSLAYSMSPIVINWTPKQLKERTEYYYIKLKQLNKLGGKHMNKVELDKAIDLSSYNDKGKKEIMKFFFCHPRIYQTIKNKGAEEVWLAVKDYVGKDGVSLEQLNDIINTHLKRIDECKKGLR